MKETNPINGVRKAGVADVAVIGGGFSGLIAAIVAAERGKTVRLFTKGAGSLVISGGTIDVLGYAENLAPVSNPLAGFSQLANDHPYSKAGEETIKNAVEFFLKLCREEAYEYLGDLSQATWLPTVAGTLKPSCLVPETMNSSILKTAKTIFVLAFSGLKDYYPALVLKSVQKYLRKYPGANPDIDLIEIKQEINGARDVSTLDIAISLERSEGQEKFILELASAIKPGAVLVVPPILGTSPGYSLMQSLQKRLECQFLEIVSIPPALTGLRLAKMLLKRAKKAGVYVMEQAAVARVVMAEGKCISLITSGLDRERAYQAKSFVLATGGFFGGGLEAGVDKIRETVFGFPVNAPSSREDWSQPQLFSGRSQNFAKIGLDVNANFQPIDSKANLLAQNVYVVGRNIAGYDNAFEKSGNGVALVSGYKVGMLV